MANPPIEYPMETVCAMCGQEYGEHRATDDLCPPDPEEGLVDGINVWWKDSKFVPADKKP